MGIKVLVCGGRDFADVNYMAAGLQRTLLNENVELFITGGAPGADTIADQLAEKAGIQRVIVPANWNGRGRAAGMERNRLMLDLFHPDKVLAFPGGVGTAGMKRIARDQGIQVIEL